MKAKEPGVDRLPVEKGRSTLVSLEEMMSGLSSTTETPCSGCSWVAVDYRVRGTS